MRVSTKIPQIAAASSLPTPYYEENGIVIYCGDARDIAPHVVAESVITDPVWPNSAFPSVSDPEQLLRETLARTAAVRVVIHLGCNSDPRFLRSIPERYPFIRTCWLEYACPSYVGRVLNTSDIAYAFGAAPASRPGGRVLPGRVVSTRGDKVLTRGTGRGCKTKVDYSTSAHPTPRRLQHVRWLCKWLGGASVYDPFLGSGTTAVACKALGIPFVGSEVEERFCALAVERLRQGSLNLCEASA